MDRHSFIFACANIVSCSIQCLHGLQLMMTTSLDTSERLQNEDGLKQEMTILEFGDEMMNPLKRRRQRVRRC